MAVLDQVNFPEDLAGLSDEELCQLATEIRKKIIDTVSVTGGHLGPNLGVVELTIALHRVFHMPQDRLVWDVGHQCYTHKILTGRKDAFDTLRQYQGLSGFPKPQESEYDSFITGHASTSVSAALGMAEALRLQHHGDHVVAVLGDGALTGGMVYEAMNHGGGLGRPLIVVLNDNDMSIAKNVGSLAGHLARLRTSPKYISKKNSLKGFLGRLPGIGEPLIRFISRSKEGLKYFLLPGVFFEEMGFTYLGPVDGHNMQEMESLLEIAKHLDRPALVHVLTEKGHGYAPAVAQPQVFHGVGPFDRLTGKPKASSGVSYTSYFSKALCQLAEADSRIVGITAAMLHGTGLDAFGKQFPDRCYDVGIAEGHALTFAAGMAAAGMRPVAAIYSSFLQRGYDQILHDICIPQLPVVLAVDRAGLVGEDGETHQGIFDLAMLRTMPNLAIAMPADGAGIKPMLELALAQAAPVALRYPRGTSPEELSPAPYQWGKGAWLTQGADVAVLAVGPMVQAALEAAEILVKQGVHAAVADLRFIKPLDQQLLDQAARYPHVLIVEEATATGGVGSGILEYWQSTGFIPRVARLSLPDAFIPQGSVRQLRQAYGLTPEHIAQIILQKRM